jgi:hypothetical protein
LGWENISASSSRNRWAIQLVIQSKRTGPSFKPMPTFVKILLACLICLGVVGGLIWLMQRLAA